MNKFFGGGKGHGFGGGFGGGARGGFDAPREMFPAECGECGDACQVPFRPTGERPVFCKNCFRKDDAPRGPKFGARPSFGGPRSFGDKPAYRSTPRQTDNGLADQVKMLNAKMDTLIALLGAKREPKNEE